MRIVKPWTLWHWREGKFIKNLEALIIICILCCVWFSFGHSWRSTFPHYTWVFQSTVEANPHCDFFFTEQSSSHTDYTWTLFFADSVQFPPVILSPKRGICLQLFHLKSSLLLIMVPRSSAVPVWPALVLWALSVKREVVNGLQRQLRLCAGEMLGGGVTHR